MTTTLKHKLPNGQVAKRRTPRAYTHVVIGEWDADNAAALRMAAREMTAQPVADAIERDRLRDQVKVLRQALQAMRNNVDCSTINNSKRSVARWEELVDLATEALKASTP